MERLQRGGVALLAGHDVHRAVQRRHPPLWLTFWPPRFPSGPERAAPLIHEKTIQRLSRAYRFGRGWPWRLAANGAAWALEPFTVRDIRVEGLQRVEPGTVFASMPFRVGDQYNDDKGSAAIRRCLRWAFSRTCAWRSTATCWW
jgi:hypothetical protein